MARGEAGRRPASAEWHLGAALGCAVARPAGGYVLTRPSTSFNRWRRAGLWDRLMDEITKAYDGRVQMIDSSIVRVHQHAAGAKKGVEIVAWAVLEAD